MKDIPPSVTYSPIPVFLVCDTEYLPFALTTILSVLEHCSRKIIFHLLHDGSISPREIKTAQTLVSTAGGEIVFTKWQNGDCFKTWSKRFPPLVYVRLLLPEMFPQYDRAIFMDADILVSKDISELYNFDLKGKFIGAVPEGTWINSYKQNVPLDKKFQNIGFAEYYDKLGFSPQNTYYNAGVLLLDMKELRKANAAGILLKHAYGDLLYQDQDILNVFMNDWIAPLPTCWNKTYRLGEYEAGTMRHFIDKPWQNSSRGGDFGNYWRSLQKNTPFFYRARAELIICEIEASINSLWRQPGDSALKALLKLSWYLVGAAIRRIKKLTNSFF